MERDTLWSEWEKQIDIPGHPLDGELGCISYPALVSDERAECHYGQVVVVIDGGAMGIADLPPGELQVPPDLMERCREYPCQPLSDRDREEYWTKARPMSGHWHPDARLVQY